MATGSSDGTIRLWDTGSGKAKGTLRGVTAEQAVMCVDFQGSYVAGGANDSVVRVWDVATERVRVRMPAPRAAVEEWCGVWGVGVLCAGCSVGV